MIRSRGTRCPLRFFHVRWQVRRKRKLSIQRRPSSQFQVVDHVISAQHTRHWPRGRDPTSDKPLRLAAKQYIPINNPEPSAGDITFVGTHANGLPKELYEPLWADLSEKLLALKGRRIRSIWIADMVNQGQSAILNEQLLGNDPSWFDFSRDLLHLINQNQLDMPSPLVGIGHSVGGAQLAYLSLFHPRLFQALVLIDPTIQTENPGKAFAAASTFRRDVWSSRSFAREKFAASKFYSTWDRRAFDKWIEYGLKDVAITNTADQKPLAEQPVTLSTAVSQEVFLYQRPKYHQELDQTWHENKTDYSDLHPDDDEPEYPFYRPEPAQVFRRLPELYPPVLYIFGAKSPVSTTELRQKKLEATGTGIGGSGGQKHSQVEEVVLDCGHMVPFEKVEETADAISRFSTLRINQWSTKADREKEIWLQTPRPQRAMLDTKWKEMIREPLSLPREPRS